MTEQMSEMCEHCGGTPCDQLVFGEEITDNISNMQEIWMIRYDTNKIKSNQIK